MRGWFECFCRCGSFTKDELIKHVKDEHPEQSELWLCEACDQSFKTYDEAKEHVLWKHDIYCDECQDAYIYDVFMPVWYFTVEKDIPILARTEEDAERMFRSTYGNKPVLGIIRPEPIKERGMSIAPNQRRLTE